MGPRFRGHSWSGYSTATGTRWCTAAFKGTGVITVEAADDVSQQHPQEKEHLPLLGLLGAGMEVPWLRVWVLASQFQHDAVAVRLALGDAPELNAARPNTG